MRINKTAIISALIAQAAIPAAAGERKFINIVNPTILTGAECIQPYVAAYSTGRVGADVIATLEHDGCIRHLQGAYEADVHATIKPDANFAEATLRLREGSRAADTVKTPAIVDGFVFRSQLKAQ